MRIILFFSAALVVAALTAVAEASSLPQYKIVNAYTTGYIDNVGTSNNVLTSSGDIAYTTNRTDTTASFAGILETPLQNGQMNSFDVPISFAFYVSPDGSVVGGGDDEDNAQIPAPFVSNNGVVTRLSVPNAGEWTGGDVSGTAGSTTVGNYYVSATQQIGAVWQGATMINDLGPQAEYSWIAGMNTAGVMGGGVYKNASQPIAAVWQSDTATSYVDIGAGTNSGITVVQPNGLMLGYSANGAFTYSQSAGLKLIGAPAGVSASLFTPQSMNDDGVVTGNVFDPNGDSSVNPTAYIGLDGQYATLNSLVADNPNGYYFREAWTNDNTLYADYTTADSGNTEYLAVLQQVPEPSGFGIGGSLFVLLLLHRHRSPCQVAIGK